MGFAGQFRTILSNAAERAAKAVGQFAGHFERARSEQWIPSPQRRRKPQTGEQVFAAATAGGTLFGYPGGWAQDRIEAVNHFREWVWKAIDARGKFIAGCPPNVGIVRTGKPEGKHKSCPRYGRYQKTMHVIKPHEEVEHFDSEHPLVRLLKHPNDFDDWGQFSYELEMFSCLTGNWYVWVVPNRLGYPAELWIIPSHWVWPRVGRADEHSGAKWVKYYEIRPFVGPGVFYLSPEEVIHGQRKNPIHKLDGKAPTDAIATWIDTAESINLAQFWSFKNAAFPFGAIELSESYHDPDDNDIDRIGAKFYSRYQGETRTGLPIILPPGAKYNTLMMKPSEMIFEASQDQRRDMILCAFDTPKEVCGIQDAGSEIAMYGPLAQFCFHGINPALRSRDSLFTRHLASRWGEHVRIWTDDPTPENPQERRADLQLAAQNGWITPNEGRAILLNLEPYLYGGDDPLVPQGLVPLPLGTGEDLSGFAELEGLSHSPPKNGDGEDDGGKGGILPGAGKRHLPLRTKVRDTDGNEHDRLGLFTGTGNGAAVKDEAESELSPQEDYKQNGTRAKAFKEWFGDWEKDPESASKVVDKEGKPLVVYHGTSGVNFDEFAGGKEFNPNSNKLNKSRSKSRDAAGHEHDQLGQFIVHGGELSPPHEDAITTEKTAPVQCNGNGTITAPAKKAATLPEKHHLPVIREVPMTKAERHRLERVETAVVQMGEYLRRSSAAPPAPPIVIPPISVINEIKVPPAPPATVTVQASPVTPMIQLPEMRPTFSPQLETPKVTVVNQVEPAEVHPPSVTVTVEAAKPRLVRTVFERDEEGRPTGSVQEEIE